IYIALHFWARSLPGKDGGDHRGVSGGYSRGFILLPFSLLLSLWVVAHFIVIPESQNWYLCFGLFNFEIFDLVGLVILGVGAILQFSAIRAMGSRYRVLLPRQPQGLITFGVYKNIRHPIIFSLILMTLGIFMICPNLLTLFNLILVIYINNQIIKFEEEYLLAVYGERYEEYSVRASRFIPHIY
ncbi:isoprenylcysteine carboxylmethyltransferase family protein, partial [bacterium]|nr:isoprenylcysteine carboxylmethyltransferase family protein [bacterium]